MFLNRTKKRRSAQKITLLDRGGGELGIWDMRDFPLPEELVIELSTRYFNDSEPCHIHRSAVHVRAMVELADMLEKGKPCAISALPEAQQRYFPEEAAKIRIDDIQL